MIASEFDYNELYGNIAYETDTIVAAKCCCVACNSCACGRCTTCISQCTGCKGALLDEELEWEVA